MKILNVSGIRNGQNPVLLGNAVQRSLYRSLRPHHKGGGGASGGGGEDRRKAVPLETAE